MAEGVNPEPAGDFFQIVLPRIIEKPIFLSRLPPTRYAWGSICFLFQYPGFGATRLTSLACFRLRQGYAETSRPRKPLLRDTLASA